MSDFESFEVTELDDKDLEDVSGGVEDNDNCCCNNDNCGCPGDPNECCDAGAIQ